MDHKSATTMTASPAFFPAVPVALDRPLGAVARPGLRNVGIAGVALAIGLFAVASFEWLPASVESPATPLAGKWGCTLAGAPAGTLSVDGWNYVLGANQTGGTLERVLLEGKYLDERELLRVQSGPLEEQFGVKLGYHNQAVTPAVLTFSIGPGSGIRCTRM